jgi:1,4-alpha-glucan branching enzyme
MLHNRGPRHNKVEICGSFDNWDERHELQFDPFTNQWFVTLHLKVGEEYLYKYVLNDDQWVTNEEEPNKMDSGGNKNNYCAIMI